MKPLCFQLVNGSKFPTLDPVAGDRAFLLKDHQGDWGIAVGRWEGFRKGVPGTPGNYDVIACI